MISRTVRTILVAAVLLAAGYRATRSNFSPTANSSRPRVLAPPPPDPASRPRVLASDSTILAAIRDQRSHVWGELTAVVDRLLKDDREGSPHQRFLVRLASGTTVLVAYNLELAPRITPLAVGDTVQLRGEYIWNDKGGVMHWVHRDPSGKRAGGWVRVHGVEFR